jgi:hypothetical protein
MAHLNASHESESEEGMKRFIFHVPIQSISVVTLDAQTEADAWDAVQHGKYYEMYSMPGTTPTGKTELVGVQELEGGNDA